MHDLSVVSDPVHRKQSFCYYGGETAGLDTPFNSLRSSLSALVCRYERKSLHTERGYKEIQQLDCKMPKKGQSTPRKEEPTFEQIPQFAKPSRDQ